MLHLYKMLYVLLNFEKINIQKLIDLVVEDLELQWRYKVVEQELGGLTLGQCSFDIDLDGCFFGEMSISKKHVIKIRPFRDLNKWQQVVILMHEFRHAWQHEHEIMREENYIKPEENFVKYEAQECERDARQYANPFNPQIVGKVYKLLKENK